jgi:hypothetical protein
MPRKVVLIGLIAFLLLGFAGVSQAAPVVDVSLEVEGKASEAPGDPGEDLGSPSAPKGPLPNTGYDLMALLIAAMALIAAGKVIEKSSPVVEGAAGRRG